MTTCYVLLLSYSDRSGPIQAFGPYNTPEQAKAAEAEIGSWPSIHPGVWDVLPCTDPTPAPMEPAGTCDASTHGLNPVDPLGPCILRHGHDGPVHKAANGATWWQNEEA